MTVPVFEEYEPAIDCGCAGCALQRRTAAARTLPPRRGGHPAAHGARRALVLATAAGVVLSAGTAGAAPPPGRAAGPARADDAADPGPRPVTPQGQAGPLKSPGPPATGSPLALRTTTRGEIITRAKKWVAAKVPYDMEAYWSDGYRQDCSGYVSMAWDLGTNEWTGSLSSYGTRIARSELEPGDILLFHDPADPNKGSHVTIFGGWTNGAHSQYMAYEQTPPAARQKTTPLAYWSDSGKYVAYRYKGLAAGAGGGSPSTAFPGAGKFGPGADNAYVTRLGEMLVDRGGKRFYAQGPGPRWSEADRRATRAFQRAQGWKGANADGIPGPDTWRRLVGGTGRSIGTAGAGGSPSAVPAFPGRGYFKPGQSNAHVERLGRQLVKKGYGKHYVSGPGRRWTEADRRNVEAFQRALGWRGGVADGYPGPETWRRLFA